MSQAKKHLSLAKDLIEKKDYGGGKDHCLAALHDDPNSINALVLLGFCETNLRSFTNAESAYTKVTELNPKLAYGWQGLLTVYEKDKKVSKYIQTVKKLVELYEEEDDINKATSVVNKMQTFVLAHGTSDDKMEMLTEMLPGKPIFSYLEGRIPHPSQTLEKLTYLLEQKEKDQISGTIQKARNRLGVNTSVVARDIKKDVYGSSKLEAYLSQLLDWADDDVLRRTTEERLFVFLYNKLLSVPNEREETRSKLMKLAEGMVVVKSSMEQAWRIVLEWNDCADLSELDYGMLEDYIALFPTSGLSRVLQAFLRSDLSSFQRKSVNDDKPDGDLEIDWDDAEILENLIDGYESASDSPLANRILCHYYVHIGDYENAIDMASAGFKILDRLRKDSGLILQNYTLCLTVFLGTSYVYYEAPRHFPEALKLFEKVPKKSKFYSEALIGKALILVENGRIEEALSVLMSTLKKDPHNIRVLSEVSWCKALLGNYDLGRQGMEKCLSMIKSSDPFSMNLKAKLWYRVGICFWNGYPDRRNDKSLAYQAFMTSLKCNASYASSYTQLGLYYSDIVKDEERALRCFHKAFELDPNQTEAARHLIEKFSASQDWDLVEAVAARYTDADKKRSVAGSDSMWAYKVLGVAYLESNNVVKAIQAFQSALRVQSTDSHAWAALGEAYAKSGSYVAAAKALTRAVEMDSGNWHAKLFLGIVHRQILSLEEAKAVFLDVLASNPDEAVVLDRLTETLIASSRRYVETNNYGHACEDCLLAIDMASRLAKLKPSSFNVWKYIGDAVLFFIQIQSMLHRLPLKKLKELLGVEINDKSNGSLDFIASLDGVNCENLGGLNVESPMETAGFLYILAYKLSLMVSFDNERVRGVGWFNIANAQLRMYRVKSDTTRYRDAAIECYKLALRQDPRNSLYWNAYGIAIADYAPIIAQHAFIRSLVIDYRQTATWVNLGALYLAQGDLQLANLSFSRAQMADPEFVPSWVGQGLIAVMMGENEEAQELFDHSFAITDGTDKLTMLLYAVLTYLVSLSRSLTAAKTPLPDIPMFALNKLLQHDPASIPALRYLAIYQEKLQIHDLAVKNLEDACAILEMKYDELEGFEELCDFVAAKSAVARSYLAQKEYKLALEASLFVIDLAGDEPKLKSDQISSLLTAGMAYCEMSDHNSALQMISQASAISERNPDIAILMAQVLYALGSAYREKSADILFENIEHHSDHLKSLLLLGTVGLVDHNTEVIDAIESVLKTFNAESRSNVRSVELLLSCIEGAKTGIPSIKPWLESAILSPSDHKVWSRINPQIAERIALSDKHISAREISKVLAETHTFENSLRATFFSPGCIEGWKSLNMCMT